MSTPGVILIDPKYPFNVGGVIRALHCHCGTGTVRVAGKRVPLKPHRGYRLPREERHKNFEVIDVVKDDRPFDHLNGSTPVAVEVLEHAENLLAFEHPEDAVYVFGPEDGSIPPSMLRHCHRFVRIPTTHCLNLAAAVNVVLWDRRLKEIGE